MIMNWRKACLKAFRLDFCRDVRRGQAQHELLESQINMPYTAKKGDGHGIGLKNMLRVAKEYMGDLLFEQNVNVIQVA